MQVCGVSLDMIISDFLDEKMNEELVDIIHLNNNTSELSEWIQHQYDFIDILNKAQVQPPAKKKKIDHKSKQKKNPSDEEESSKVNSRKKRSQDKEED